MRFPAILLLAAAVHAQDLTHKAPPQAEVIGIWGATVHTVIGWPVENGVVLFEKGRITLVSKPKEIEKIGRVIDGTGKHVYPGFISPYSRLGLTEFGQVRATLDFNEVGTLTPEVRTAVAVNPDSTLLPVTRSNGVLLFTAFPGGGLMPGRASVMRMDGWTWEDMAVRADAGLVVRWPTDRRDRRRHPRREDAPPDPAQRRIAKIGEMFARARAYLRARDGGAALPRDIRFEAMRLAVEGKRPVFFEANEYDQIVGAVHFAARHELRAVIVGGRDAPLCLDVLKRHDVAVIVNSVHRFPKRSDSGYDDLYRLPAKLEAAGLRWCLASGERVGNERNLPYSAARAVAYGLDRHAAVKSITLGAARVLGIDEDYGSLEQGKSATLFLCDGDPLEITTRIERAFIDGREIDLSNKQIKLAEKYREKYRQSKKGK